MLLFPLDYTEEESIGADSTKPDCFRLGSLSFPGMKNFQFSNACSIQPDFSQSGALDFLSTDSHLSYDLIFNTVQTQVLL